MSEKTKIMSESFESIKEAVLHPHFHMSVAFMGAASLTGFLSHNVKHPLLAAETASYANHAPIGSSSHEERRENEVHPRHWGNSAGHRAPEVAGSL